MTRKTVWLLVSSLIVTTLLVTSCTPRVTEEREASPTQERVAPQIKGETIVVDSTADNGSGTLREALLDAESGDTITFDPSVFPASAPATIYLTTSLPLISQGNLKIDAGNAGVIIDGSNVSEEWPSGLEIGSDGNIVQGLQIANFSPGTGIALGGGAQYNTIGGDRSIGSGPLGEGNLVSNVNTGITLFDDGTSLNIITGNLIGTDPAGIKAWGNHGIGVHILNGASHNIIGPDNIIAYNDTSGIGIQGLNSLGNTITQNSIHDNKERGIYLWEGGNTELPVPVILDFDLAAGTVTGFACAECTVEIFSDSSDEGEVYEGRTTADGSGFFSLSKGAPLVGPCLTATATDADGNTSGFSAPTSGTYRATSLQEGNNLSRVRLQPKESRELEDNHIGGDIGNWVAVAGDNNTELYTGLLNSIRDLGLKWLRTNFWSPNPLNWQEVLQVPGVYSIPQDCDDFITDLANDGINIVLTLSAGAGLDGQQYDWWGGPGWAVLGNREPEWWFNTQEDRDRFIDYVTFMVQHFKGRVRYYEIWNEPSAGKWDARGEIALDDYVSLVKQVAPLIGQIDPEAKIVVGAVGRFHDEDRQWLQKMLGSEVESLIDAISWHPFYGESPFIYTGEYPQHPEPFYWKDYPSNVESFRHEAVSLGFHGEYMVEEMVWRTPTDLVPHESPLYTDVVAAKYAARAIIIHLGWDFTMVSNQMLMPDIIKLVPRYYVIRNLCTIMAGAAPIDLPMEIQSEVTNVRSCSFSLPNGDKLIALWTDGVAMDEDPGAKATLTIPNFSAEEVVGIDVLYGFEQELITSTVDGNLVIENLLIRDYPIILRLIP